MNAAVPVSQNQAIHHRHSAAHVGAPKVATPNADAALKAASVKAPSLTLGQFLNKTA